MKKSFLFLLLSLVIGLVSACKDDNDNNNDDPFLTAKVGTTTFTASSINSSSANNVLTITGVSGSNTIIITLPVGATGQQAISLVSAPVSASYMEETFTYTGYTGNVNVTEWDSANKTVTGTFVFDAQIAATGAQKNITDGDFSVTYQ